MVFNRNMEHFTSRVLPFAAVGVLLSVSLECVQAQCYYAPRSHSYLTAASRRIDFPSVPGCSYIRFGGGFRGANGATVGKSGFHSVSNDTYSIVGGSAVRFMDAQGMMEFFAEEPQDTYRITSIRQGVVVEYKHCDRIRTCCRVRTCCRYE